MWVGERRGGRGHGDAKTGERVESSTDTDAERIGSVWVGRCRESGRGGSGSVIIVILPVGDLFAQFHEEVVQESELLHTCRQTAQSDASARLRIAGKVRAQSSTETRSESIVQLRVSKLGLLEGGHSSLSLMILREVLRDSGC